MDQMNAHIYRLHGQIYRRNIPLELIPASYHNINDHKFNDYYKEEQEEDQEEKDLDGNDDIVIPEHYTSDDEQVLGIPCGEKETVFKHVKYDQRRKTYYAKVNIPTKMLGKLIGPDKKNFLRLQSYSYAKIILPRRTENANSVIEIEAPSKIEVERIRDLFELEVIKCRRQFKPTHFLSIDLSGFKPLTDAYTAFVEKICSCPEVSEELRNTSLFQPIEKLHITISSLRLYSPEDEAFIKEFINDLFDINFHEFFFETNKIEIQIKTLDFFGDSPSRAKALFVKVKSQKLQRLANEINEALIAIGFAEKRRGSDVVLHMTILKPKGAENEKPKINIESILAKFKSCKFPITKVTGVRICIMNEVDPYTNGYPNIFSRSFS